MKGIHLLITLPDAPKRSDLLIRRCACTKRQHVGTQYHIKRGKYHVCVRLLLFLLILFSWSSALQSRPYSKIHTRDDYVSLASNRVNNVTVKCGGYTARRKIVFQCQRDLYRLTWNGYPWSPTDTQGTYRNDKKLTDRNNTLGDALDSLKHVCYIYMYDRSPKCLQENGVRDYCIATTEFFAYQTDFQFICHHTHRDELSPLPSMFSWHSSSGNSIFSYSKTLLRHGYSRHNYKTI